MIKLVIIFLLLLTMNELYAQNRVVLVKLNKSVDTTVQLKMISNSDTIAPYSKKLENDTIMSFYFKSELIAKDSILVNFILIQGRYNYPFIVRTNSFLKYIFEFEITKIIKRKNQFYSITSYDIWGEVGWRLREKI